MLEMNLEREKSVPAVGKKKRQNDKSFSDMFFKNWIPLSDLFLHRGETVYFRDEELVLVHARWYFCYSQDSRLNRKCELVISAS